MLKWEGAPDTAFFRSISWAQMHELPAGAAHTADGVAEQVQFVVDVTVPAGALSERRREGLVGDFTEIVRTAAGLPAEEAYRIWVLVREVPEGFWGAGGQIVRF